MGMTLVSTEWGNVADWASVVVGLGAAAATVFVAVTANRTSRKAAEIADEAKGIAQQQHDEMVSLRMGNARVIGRLLLTEIGALPNRLDMISRLLADSLTTDGGPGVKDFVKFRAALDEAEEELMPASVAVLDRIHNLPDVLGADLATLIGTCQALNTVASRVKARSSVAFATPAAGGAQLRYGGNLRELALLAQQCAESTVMAAHFAVEFRAYVGVDRGDYSAVEATASGMLQIWTDAEG